MTWGWDLRRQAPSQRAAAGMAACSEAGCSALAVAQMAKAVPGSPSTARTYRRGIQASSYQFSVLLPLKLHPAFHKLLLLIAALGYSMSSSTLTCSACME